MLVRQLEEELRMRMRGPNMELTQQVELLLNENDHLTREVAILRETIKVPIHKRGTQPFFFIRTTVTSLRVMILISVYRN